MYLCTPCAYERLIFHGLFSSVKMLCIHRAVFHCTDLETVDCVVPGSFPSLLLFVGSTVYLAGAALCLSPA